MRPAALRSALVGLGLVTTALGCTPAPKPAPSQLEIPPKPLPSPEPALAPTTRTADKRACVQAGGELDPATGGVVKAFCSDVINAKVPGAAMVLRTPAGERVALAHGMRCNGRPDPVRIDTPFRLASLTKPLTALLVLTLVERDRLRLDETLGQHLPELSRSPWAGLTIEQLLTHTAGLPEQGAVVKRMPSVAKDADWLETLARLPATPGESHEGFEYSNLGYDLLGEVAARKLDRGWPEIIETELIEPLELADATAHESSAAPRAACGHLAPTSAGIPVNADASLTQAGHPWKRPSGSALGSALDLERLAMAVTAAEPDSDDALERALARSLEGETPAGHGQLQSLAWRRLPGEGTPVYRHTGALGHFTAELYFSQDGRFVLAYLANSRHKLRGTVAAALGGFSGATLVE